MNKLRVQRPSNNMSLDSTKFKPLGASSGGSTVESTNDAATFQTQLSLGIAPPTVPASLEIAPQPTNGASDMEMAALDPISANAWLHFQAEEEQEDDVESQLVGPSSRGSLSSAAALLPSQPALFTFTAKINKFLYPVVTSIPFAISVIVIFAILTVLLSTWGVGEAHYRQSQRRVMASAARQVVSNTNNLLANIIRRAPEALEAVHGAAVNAGRSLPTVESGESLQTMSRSVSRTLTNPHGPSDGVAPVSPWWQFYSTLALGYASMKDRAFNTFEMGFADGSSLLMPGGASLSVFHGVYRPPPAPPTLYTETSYLLGYRNQSNMTVPNFAEQPWYNRYSPNATSFSSRFGAWGSVTINWNGIAEASLVGNVVRMGRAKVTFDVRLNYPEIANALTQYGASAYIISNRSIIAGLDGTSQAAAAKPMRVSYPSKGVYPNSSEPTTSTPEPITVAERIKGCWYDTSLVVMCPHTPSTIGSEPLRVFVGSKDYHAFDQLTFGNDSSVIDSSSVASSPPLVSEVDDHLVSAMPILVKGTLQPQSTWMLVIVIPASSLSGDISDGRQAVAPVTSVVAIVVIVGTSTAIWLLYRPVANVSRAMGLVQKRETTGSELDEDDEASLALTPEEIQQRETERNILADRRPSIWPAVRTMQQVHWAAVDELRELRAYVPEHIKAGLAGKGYGPLTIGDANNKGAEDGVPPTVHTTTSLGAGSTTLGTSNSMAAAAASNTNDTSKEEGPHGYQLHFEADQAPHARSVYSEVLGGALDSELTRFTLNGFPAADTTDRDMESLPDVDGPRDPQHSTEGHHRLDTTSNCTACGIKPYEIPDDLIPAESPQRVAQKLSKPPIIFADSCLVDRDITVAHINILAFHMYARRSHGPKISADYAEFITFLNTEAKRFGGVLESFSGDKFWISFNATTKCSNHQIACAYFAYHVTCVINNAALGRMEGQLKSPLQPSMTVTENSSLWEYGDPFAMCQAGISCGLATGRAFVGPLGNRAIRSHNIISNAMSEAAALERQSLHYAGCSVLIGGDMVPAIEGYCQYLLLDASLLPGSHGKRRRIACLKGPMIGRGYDPAVVKRWLVRKESIVADNYPLLTPYVYLENMVSHAVPNLCKYQLLNGSFNALLEGQGQVANALLRSARRSVGEGPDTTISETFEEYTERKAVVDFMYQLISSFLRNSIDGRTYRSSLGEAHQPFTRMLTMPTPQSSHTNSLRDSNTTNM